MTGQPRMPNRSSGSGSPSRQNRPGWSGRYLSDQVVEVSLVRHPLATAVADEPAAALFPGDAVQQQTQDVLRDPSHVLPREEALPACYPVEVERVGSYTVESPVTTTADVVGAEDQDFLDVALAE